MKTEKVSLFQHFKDSKGKPSMNQGFERMLSIAEKIKDNGLKYEMIICYGCLIETHNQTMNNLYEKLSPTMDGEL